MFEWLKQGARGAVSAATKGVTEAAVALKALADSIARRAAEAADLASCSTSRSIRASISKGGSGMPPTSQR